MQIIFLIAFLIFLGFLTFYVIKVFLSRRFILNCFRTGSTMTCGMRRRGKDMLFNWVINKRKKKYISNVKYTKRDDLYIPFNPLSQFGVGNNTFTNFVNGNLKPYDYPYEDGIDYYIADAGVYFPSQECSYLNRLYPSFPLFQAISAQLGGCNIHWNVQNANRLWDKAREQCDCYFFLRKTKVYKFLGLVKQKLTYYDKLESCIARRKSMTKRRGRIGRIEYDKYCAQYGEIKDMTIWFRLPYKYDDRIFKTMLKKGVDQNETK